ncbi:Uu.00g059070.m01.CDS01 [Anthostomella pinea]|uniref:Uu.00g059070.m01.CDS01 n=1 Tax=Anthostomella pinea TaxID=933095 RepID=A0AAI8YMA5_9PEZI|nr:Uu.00g059070.m01.CDS01 [Anthostomella pinea]
MGWYRSSPSSPSTCSSPIIHSPRTQFLLANPSSSTSAKRFPKAPLVWSSRPSPSPSSLPTPSPSPLLSFPCLIVLMNASTSATPAPAQPFSPGNSVRTGGVAAATRSGFPSAFSTCTPRSNRVVTSRKQSPAPNSRSRRCRSRRLTALTSAAGAVMKRRPEPGEFDKVHVPWDEVYAMMCNLDIGNMDFDDYCADDRFGDFEEQGGPWRGKWWTYAGVGEEMSEGVRAKLDEDIRRLEEERLA